ncbi:WD40 repeat domain-containing protein [Streptosporangium sp. NPDC002721]|uniref:WD40 repeat domain-containing protein n=1 Tax=Streptosporangium sp. NPDC002721 TaxID=3366188 RepID=UPI0036C53E58
MIAALTVCVTLVVGFWPSADLVGRHDDVVLAVSLGQMNGQPVAVTVGGGMHDDTMRVWDLTTRELIGEPIAGQPYSVETVAVGQVNGRPVAVTGSVVGTVRVWDLTTRKPMGEPMTRSHTGSVGAVAIGEVNGRPVAVTAGDLGTETHKNPVRVWDLITREPLGEPMTGHTGPVLAVAVGQVNGRPVAVTGSVDGTVRVWDLTTRKPVGEPMTSRTGVWGVAIGEVNARPVAVTGSEDQNMRVWDLTKHTLIGEPVPTGHTHGVSAVAVGQVNGRPVAVTGGSNDSGDGSVRVWDLATRRPIGDPMGYTNRVFTVAVGWVNGQPVTITGDGDGTVRMRDLNVYTR